MSIRPEPVYIIAGTLAQAKATAIDHQLPSSPWTKHWVWVQSIDTLRGLRGPTVIFGYGAAERRDWEELSHWLTFLEPKPFEAQP